MDMKVKVAEAFKKKDVIESRYVPRFPEAAEREYIRLTNEYVKLLREALEEHLPEMKAVMWKETRMDDAKSNEKDRQKQRMKGFAVMVVQMEEIFSRIKRTLEEKTARYDIGRRMREISDRVRMLTVKEWKKTVGKTLGISIFEDYYLGDFYREAIEKWISDNVDLIQSIPHEALGDMKRMVYECYVQGKTVTELTKEIQDRYQVCRSKANLIARDQIGKLNADITKHQQTDAGIRKYEWVTAGDSKVRDSHKILGKPGKNIYSWDDPPEVAPGRRCHPGQDYQCRCRTRAIFERNNVNLPV